ncbi:thiamine-phosphate kinase, partial [Salinisphaera sp. SWV1]|uniref:thiamine-phosphate kinase n=1 Tax=Salinisphaera sp. SWV1 TaxID=3454139 RepID=UPI003F82B0B6
AGAGARALIARLTRPTPREGMRLRGLAHAAIDVSDGLVADLGHILAASDVGARVDVDALPASPALIRHIVDSRQRRQLQATGGDDYELCLTLDPADLERARAALNGPLTVIGRIERATGLRLTDATGRVLDTQALSRAGWDHFDGR